MQIPGADRRRGDQPPLRPARAVRRRRARVRAGRVLLQGRVRGARDDGRAAGRRAPRRRSSRKLARRRAQRRVPAHDTSARTSRSAIGGGERSDVRRDNPVPRAPFFGTRVLRDIPLDEVFELLDLDELYRLQWGGRGSGAEYERTVREEFEPTLARLKAEAKRGRLAAAAGGVRLLPGAERRATICRLRSRARTQSDGGRCARSRASTSRGRKGASGCASPTTSARRRVGDVDVVAFQVVTVGDEATRRFEALQAAGEYTRGVLRARPRGRERRRRSPSGCTGASAASSASRAAQGKRYSWGYGACPDLEDHAQLFKLLPAEEALGMELTSAFQLIPEQCTAAMIVHHPRGEVLRRAHGSGRRGAAVEPTASDRRRARRPSAS